MAKGFKHGSGGSNPLNFKVICNPQPETAKENTIWVDTDKINNYYFSATQPENMADYDVWVSTGTSSNVAFNVLKKNGIQVYPISAKQYISGALVDKTAMSYQGGAWVDWCTWFYRYGNAFTDVTGGWVGRYQAGHVSSAQQTEYGLYTKQTSNVGAYISNWYTKSKVDVSSLNKICAKMSTSVPGNNAIRLGLSDENTDAANRFDLGFSVITNSNEKVNILEFDVSAVFGSHYIKLNYQGGGSADVYWQEVWGE